MARACAIRREGTANSAWSFQVRSRISSTVIVASIFPVNRSANACEPASLRERRSNALYDFVLKRCPKTSSKKIVRASLLALTDPGATDKIVLDTIYGLAIKHRMDEVRVTDDYDEEEVEEETEIVPSVKSSMRRKTESRAAVQQL